jgi:hypothetical protein
MTFAAPTTGRTILRATLVAGTLDILSALLYAALEGRQPAVILIGIASAVWPDARHGSIALGMAAGLALHFAIMLAMAAAFVLASRKLALLGRQPLIAGPIYGVLLWALMNLVVLPLRWPALFPHITPLALTEQLFSHIALVGLPIAWFASRRSAPL